MAPWKKGKGAFLLLLWAVGLLPGCVRGGFDPSTRGSDALLHDLDGAADKPTTGDLTPVAPRLAWEKNLSSSAGLTILATAPWNNGTGVAVAGEFSGELEGTPAQAKDAFAAAYSAAGERIWLQAYGGTGDESFAGLVDVGGALVAAGGFDGSFSAMDPALVSAGSTDVLIAAIHQDTGDLLLAHRFGGPAVETALGLAAVGGEVLLTGLFSDTLYLGGPVLVAKSVAPLTDGFIARFSINPGVELQPLWSHGFGAGLLDVGMDIAAKGNLIAVSGLGAGEIAVGGKSVTARGFADCLVFAFDATGDPQWLETVGGAGSASCTALDVGNDRVVAGGVFEQGSVAGTSLGPFSPVGARDHLVLGYDKSGSLRYGFSMGSPGADTINDVVLDEADNAVLLITYGGNFIFGGKDLGRQPGFAVSYDKEGRPRWAFSLPGTPGRAAYGRDHRLYLSGKTPEGRAFLHAYDPGQ